MIMNREKWFLFEAQGAVANKAIEAMKGVGFDGNVPRCDAQATIDRTPEASEEPSKVFDEVRGLFEEVPALGQISLDFLKRPKTGNTVYIGSRDSGSFVRCYDAGAAHSDRYCAGATRWEVEAKNESARMAYTQFQNAASVTCCATSLVMGRLLAWQINRSWFTSDPPLKPYSGFKATDDEKKLKWVEDYWLGTFVHLMQRGYADQLAKILKVKNLELRDDFFVKPYQTPGSSSAYNIGVI